MTESDNLADTINKATSPQGGAGVPEAPDGGPKPSAGQAVGGADQPAAPKRPRVPITNLELDPNKLAEEMKKSATQRATPEPAVAPEPRAAGGADQPATPKRPPIPITFPEFDPDKLAAPKRPRVPITNLELDPNKLAEEMKKSERSKTEREQVDDAELGRLSPTIRGVSRIISGLFRPR